MFADQFAALEIMVLDDELVEALRLVQRNGPDAQMFEDVLFVRRGPAGTGCLNFVLHQGGSVEIAAGNVPPNRSTDPAAQTWVDGDTLLASR